MEVRDGDMRVVEYGVNKTNSPSSPEICGLLAMGNMESRNMCLRVCLRLSGSGSGSGFGLCVPLYDSAGSVIVSLPGCLAIYRWLLLNHCIGFCLIAD